MQAILAIPYRVTSLVPAQTKTYHSASEATLKHINSLRPRRSRRHFADAIFRRIFFKENVRVSIKISLKFVPKAKGPINNNPALVQIMAWCRSGDKPLSKPMMVSLLTHICITRPQWVKQTTKTETWAYSMGYAVFVQLLIVLFLIG